MNRDEKSVVEPPKLVELDGPHAEMLARVSRAYVATPEETEKFCRTRAAAGPAPSRGARTYFPAAVAAAAVLALTLGWSAQRDRGTRGAVDVSAEAILSPGRATPARDAKSEAARHERATPLENADLAPVEPSRTTESVVARGQRDEPDVKPTAPASATPTATPAPKAAESDCRELARGGEARRAEACYLTRSTGSGLDAETAQLEVARLRRDVLDDAAGALSALEHYRMRFPNGALRREADIAHVALLVRLGRPQDALAETRALLDSSNGHERAFELHVLRGNVYKKSLGNPRLAAHEYAQAEQLDRASSEATYLLGTTLEELGDTADAIAAYRRYLEKTKTGKRAADVERRLGRLSP